MCLFRLCANKDCSYSKNDTQSVGRVYLFQFSPSQSPQPLATITGSKTFMKLGTNFAVGNPYNAKSENEDDDMLAVSASTQGNYIKLSSIKINKFCLIDLELHPGSLPLIFSCFERGLGYCGSFIYFL